MGGSRSSSASMSTAIWIVALLLVLGGAAACGSGDPSSSTSSSATEADMAQPPDTTALSSVTSTMAATTLAPTITTIVAPNSASAPGEPPSLWERLRESGGEGIGDSLYPRLGGSGYDVERYRIEMLYDPTSRQISGTSAISAMATGDLDLFSLDFFGLEARGVSINGLEADYQQVAEELIIDPPQMFQDGDPLNVVIVYEGVVTARPAQAIQGFTAGGHWAADGETFFALNEPDGSAAWAPFNDHPLDKALVTLEVGVPVGWTAVSGGRLEDYREEGQTAVYTWSMEHPVAPYLIPLAIGRFSSRSEPDWLGLEITTWYPQGMDTALLEPMSRHDEYLQFLSKVFGPYPFESIGALVVEAGVGLALEHQTLPTYDLSAVWDGVVIHELAHQWFGDSVSVADWSDIWLNEGPATLAEWLWTEETSGVAAYDQLVADNYRLFSGERFANDSVSAEQAAAAAIGRFYPPGVPLADDLFNYSVYARGALALVALRDEMGDDQFFGMLRSWLDTHRYANASTADFLSLTEETGGPAVRQLVKSWIYDPLLPPMPDRGLHPLEQEEGSQGT